MADFLDRLAAKTPTPGGGGAAAITGAIGCALARMVAAYSVGKAGDAAAEAQLAHSLASLERADQMLRRLVDEDAAAYTELTAARRAARADAAQQTAYQAAVRIAATVPLETAAIASAVIETIDSIKACANPHLMSDLAAAAEIVRAAARAAACTVRANAPLIADEHDRASISEQLDTILLHANR